ncbi:MAG: hypothetical protein ACYDHU_02295 [Acidimicrobiales bacterium]
MPAQHVAALVVVGDLAGTRARPTATTVTCGRVSPSDQGSDLDRQVSGVTARATENGYAVDPVGTEVGSAPNGEPTIPFHFSDPEVTTVSDESVQGPRPIGPTGLHLRGHMAQRP